jgi:hypothetical protein
MVSDEVDRDRAQVRVGGVLGPSLESRKRPSLAIQESYKDLLGQIVDDLRRGAGADARIALRFRLKTPVNRES